MTSDHSKFLQAGGNIKHAKYFNNVIDKAMFDIPLSQVSHQIATWLMWYYYVCLQVCFPGLHISLGIFKRIWTILEDSCTKLDLMLAEHATSGNFRGSYHKYVSALSNIVKLKEEMERLTLSARLLDHLLTYAIVSSPTPAVMVAQKSMIDKAKSQRSKAAAVVSIRLSHFSTIIWGNI